MKRFILTLGLIGSLYGETQYGKVVKITDGDTINVQTQKELLKVRILYIDTPEKFGGAKLDKDALKANISPADEQELGILATGYAKHFFQKGDSVEVDSFGKDRYGRTLGVVYKNGINYSYQIIKDGYSCIYKRASYPYELQVALKEAKQNRVGLWGKNFKVMEALCY